MGEVSDGLPMGKGELLSKEGFKGIGRGLGKASEWVDDKERRIFDQSDMNMIGEGKKLMNMILIILLQRKQKKNTGYGVIGQTRSDFRKEYWGERTTIRKCSNRHGLIQCRN